MGSTADQYRIIAEGEAWFDRSDRGRLRFEGRDVSSFLQGLFTNDVQPLEAGRGVYAAYLTPQGRMLADLRLHRNGGAVLAQVAAGRAAALAERFDQLIFTEDVRVTDVSTAVAQVTVVGSAPAAVLARIFFGDDAAGGEAALMALPPLAHAAAGDVSIVRNDEVAQAAFDLLFDAAGRSAIVSRLEAAGVREMPLSLLDALRIDAGRPAYGVDMGEDTIPLEAGLLERAISTTKGCYVGQEIIIRVLHRGGGRVARRLVKLRFSSDLESPPGAGTVLTRDGREVGRVTSAAVSPSGSGVIALGFVHRECAEPGVRLALTAEAGGHAAEIVGLAS